METYGNGGDYIGGIVGSGQMCFETEKVFSTVRFDRLSDRESDIFRDGHPDKWMLCIGRQNHSVPITNAIFNDFQSFAGSGHSDQILIIRIQEYASSVLGNIVVQLSFSLFDSLKAAETKQVRLADIGDQAVIRFTDFDQFLYVVRMVSSHLNHSKLSFRINVQDRQRHSDVVVQIALRGGDIVLHRQHSRDQFLGRCLAICPGQSDDSQTFAIHKSILSMVAGKHLKSLKRVRHDNNT